MRIRIPFSKKILAAEIVTGLIIAGAAIGIYNFSHPKIEVPDAVAQAADFPIYVPESLPPGYTYDMSSFRYVKTERVVVFQATDKAGDTIAFAQQAKPKNFDFGKFYGQYLTDTTRVSDVTYPTTIGKSTSDKSTLIMSINADGTWLTVTTKAGITNQQFRTIATKFRKF